jgi:Spy/CpxP family protein refolding chaperone
MSKKLRVAFLLSIIINVLLAGVILGALPHRFMGGSSSRERFRSDIDNLSEPARSRFQATIEEFRKSPLRQQMSEARNEAIRLLVATPFDEAAYDRQVNRISELRRQMTEQMSKDMKEVVKGLPSDQRSAIAEILKRPPRGD